MGVQVELPTLRKRRLLSGTMGTIPTRKGVERQLDRECRQWGAFADLSIDSDDFDRTFTPTIRLRENSAADTATLADSSDGSLKHLISPSTSGSSPGSPCSPRSISPSFRGGKRVEPLGSSTYHRRLRKSKQGSSSGDSSSMASDCKAGLRPSRWDSGRWSGGKHSFQEEYSSGKGPRQRKGICKCAAGATADVAVVCCCPFAVLNLLVIAFIKCPAAVVSRTMAKIKKQCGCKRERVPVHDETDDEMTTPATSRPPSRSHSYEGQDLQTWAPGLVFGDQKLWKDCFDSPDVHSVESTRSKS